MRKSHSAALLLLALAGVSCSRQNDLEALRRILDEDRQAHLQTDASLLASHLADTLLSVDDGTISRLARADVEARFRAYFAGASYHTWDDVSEPIVRLSSDRDMAWVVRQVRVDREQPGLGPHPARRQFVSAWTATYERQGGPWRMTSVTSTFLRPSETRLILDAAARNTGSLDAIRATAEVRGPRDRFQVTVHSLADGRGRIDFAHGPSAAITFGDQWIVESPELPPAALGPEMETFLRGHEVHMTLLAPESRYPDLQYSGTTTFASRPALRLSGVDRLGAAFDLFYATADTLPLGYRVADHVRQGPPPTVEVGDWEEVGGRRLFRRATFRQAAEEFVYRYVAIETAVPDADSVFARPG